MDKPDLGKVALNISEDVIVSVVKQIVRPYAEYYIEQTPNKIDDIMLPFMDDLEAAILEMVDKIDGEVG